METQTSKSSILFGHKKTAIQVPFNSAEQRNTKTIQIERRRLGRPDASFDWWFVVQQPRCVQRRRSPRSTRAPTADHQRPGVGDR